MKLSKRLETVARFAVNGVNIVDVGTDHGYIPVYLAEQGFAKRIVASDVVPGPLANARRSAREYKVEDKIEFILTDGLSGMDGDFDTVIIAGMGGDTIISILEAAPCTKNGARLIIQPQSKIERLTKWLYDFGYHIEDAALTEDMGKLYLVLSVRGGAGDAPLCEAELYVNEALFRNRDPLLMRYLKLLDEKLSRAADGMERGGEDSRCAGIMKTLHDIQKMKEEVRKWSR